MLIHLIKLHQMVSVSSNIELFVIFLSIFIRLVPTFNGKAYAEVIPRFHLPKMP